MGGMAIPMNGALKLEDRPQSGRLAVISTITENVHEILMYQPKSSILQVWRVLAVTLEIIHTTLRKSLKFLPCHRQIVQKLRPGDVERRETFCPWFLEQRAEHPAFAQNVLWTDEGIFKGNGRQNHHNSITRCF